MPRPRIAYQLYSARRQAAQDLPAALSTLSAQGYDGVEFAGFHEHTADDIKRLLTEHGLAAASSHVPLAALQEDPWGTISYHRQIGCNYIAVPYLEEGDRPGQPGFARLIPLLHRLGSLCLDAGIGLLYHNHEFEFETVSGMYGLGFLYDAVPDHLLKTEIDTCWVRYAGVDPAQYLLKYKMRAPVVHMKDYVGHKDGRSPYQLVGKEVPRDGQTAAFAFRPLGHGEQDIPSLTRAAMEAGAHWLVVEQDESPDMPPLEASRISIQELKKHL